MGQYFLNATVFLLMMIPVLMFVLLALIPMFQHMKISKKYKESTKKHERAQELMAQGKMSKSQGYVMAKQAMKVIFRPISFSK